MRPNGKRSDNRSEEEVRLEKEAAEAFYQMFVAAGEEIMEDRKTGGHVVHAGVQIGYFVLFANMFRDMRMYDENLKKQIMKTYTNAVSEYIDRVAAVDVINHFEELYKTIVEDTKDDEDLISSQKRYIIAMEIELSEGKPDPNKAGDCLIIASKHIADLMEQFAELGVAQDE